MQDAVDVNQLHVADSFLAFHKCSASMRLPGLALYGFSYLQQTRNGSTATQVGSEGVCSNKDGL